VVPAAEQPSIDAGIRVPDADKPVEPPEVPQVDKDPVGFWQTISNAIHDKNWSYVVGGILMFLVWGVRKLWSLITKQATSETAKKALPWIALSLGVVLEIALGLTTGVTWWKALVSGLTSGGSAIALWEAVFKHLMGEKKPA
jgi:hypothetical protein